MIRINSIVIGIVVSFISCSSYFKEADRWEGISDNRLQIIISEFFPFEEKVSSDKIQILIKQRIDARASLMMASHISIKLMREKISQKNDILLNTLINEAVSGGKLINFNCTENNHCYASAEYNIEALLKKLSVINNQ